VDKRTPSVDGNCPTVTLVRVPPHTPVVGLTRARNGNLSKTSILLGFPLALLLLLLDTPA